MTAIIAVGGWGSRWWVSFFFLWPRRSMKDFIKRWIDEGINSRLDIFPCIVVIGRRILRDVGVAGAGYKKDWIKLWPKRTKYSISLGFLTNAKTSQSDFVIERRLGCAHVRFCMAVGSGTSMTHGFGDTHNSGRSGGPFVLKLTGNPHQTPIWQSLFFYILRQ